MKVAGTNSWVPEKDIEKEKDIDKDIDIRVLVSFNGVQRCSTVFNGVQRAFGVLSYPCCWSKNG